MIDTHEKGNVSPEDLPPTSRAAYYHGLRVHHQIMVWSLFPTTVQFNPSEWGWSDHDNIMEPIKTDMDIAPETLKNVIRCRCRSTSKNPCSTKLCTCRKFGMPCVPSCSGCRGEDCNNCPVS